MNQRETAWLRQMIFLTMVVLAVVSSVAGVRPAFAKAHLPILMQLTITSVPK